MKYSPMTDVELIDKYLEYLYKLYPDGSITLESFVKGKLNVESNNAQIESVQAQMLSELLIEWRGHFNLGITLKGRKIVEEGGYNTRSRRLAD